MKPALAASIVLIAFANASAGLDSAVSPATDAPARFDSAASLDKMVITGTRTARSIKDNPAAVSVITRQQIESSPATNVSDLLLYEPGLMVQRSVGMGEGVPTNVNMRGVPAATAASRTLILVDGIPTNAAGTPFLILNEIPLQSIERIEVVQGPYSSLYGPNAFGGVVNIVTKNPGPGFHGQLEGSGTAGYYDCEGEGTATLGRFSLLVNASARGVDNWTGRDSIDHPFGDQHRYTNSDNYGYYDRRLFGKFGYALSSRATLTLNARYFNSDLGFGKTEYGNPSTDVSVYGQKFLIGPVLKVNVSPSLDLKVGGYYGNLSGTFYGQGIRMQADSTLDTAGSVWKSSSNDLEIDAQSTIRLGTHHTITAGFDVLDNSVDFGAQRDPATGDLLRNADSTNKSMVNGGLYAQDEMRFWRMIAIAGARVDYNSVFGAALCPKLGLVYKQNDILSLKLTAGRAFRAPSLAELYLPDLPINTSSTLVSNPALVPEYIWTVDGGPEIDLFKWMNVRVSGFYNYMNDLITQKVINQYLEDFLQNALLSNQNIENAWSSGIETSVQARLLRWGTLFFNYTFTKSENMQMKGSLDYIPEHAFNVGVYFGKAFGPITVSGSVLEDYVGSREYLDWQAAALDSTRAFTNPADFTPEYVTLAPYFRTDASVKIAYRWFWLGVNCLNLTNATIEEQAGTYAPLRLVSATVGVKF